ncbi:hypothetical protein [Flavobacterium sp.]|uniref:hypothetical protein n=1 Tax=Flavobacterium sp. TaxID=239 RepID=UPI003752AF34
MKLLYLFLILITFNSNEEKNSKISDFNKEIKLLEIPKKNKLIVDNVKKYGPEISSTYEKAVCTELLIKIVEKSQDLNSIDKKRIRIITNQNIQELLKKDSKIPKGIYFALIEKGVGIAIDNKNEVCEGDFVQFWTETWGHCGIVKSINPDQNEMELYSSFPSTNGYGIQKFNIPKYSFFVRLK